MKVFHIIVFMVSLNSVLSEKTIPTCGCAVLNDCYKKMLKELLYGDETGCIEDASLGTSTVVIFLKALQSYCGQLITVEAKNWTHNMRKLYKVTISKKNKKTRQSNKTSTSSDSKPIIMIDAGQLGDTDSVGFALYIIEQLVACSEYNKVINEIKWIILPSTNPDGLEYRRFKHHSWTKNLRMDDQFYGVDISRNFPTDWELCGNDKAPFSSHFHGMEAGSENETKLIMDTLENNKDNLMAYISLRNNGHSLLYPYSSKDGTLTPNTTYNVASNLTTKVNSKAGTVQIFSNKTILAMNGAAVCGSSVDHAYSLSIPYTYEMRVFLDEDSKIMSKYQSLPQGFDRGLRAGYFEGILELAKIIIQDKKEGKCESRRRKNKGY